MNEAGARRRFRNYLLDTRFQLKAVGIMVAAVTVVAALLGGLLWFTSQQMVDVAQEAVEARSQAVQTSRELGAASLSDELLKRFDDPAFNERMREESRRIDQRYEAERAAIVRQHELLLSRQRTMGLAIFAGLLLLVVVVAMGTLVATHRVAGPAFRLKRMMQQVGSGSLQGAVTLRKGDELQELFEEFKKMLVRLGDSQGAVLQKLDQLVERAKASGASGELVEGMEALKATLKGAQITFPTAPATETKPSGA